MSLTGKLALITGSASGIGKEIAMLFAKNGADLVLVDMSQSVFDIEKEILAAVTPSRAIRTSAHICDVSQSAQVHQVFADLKVQHEGCVANVIVNCAGILPASSLQTLPNFSEDVFDRMVSINFKGTYLVCQVASQALIEQFNRDPSTHPKDLDSYASIINISSLAAKYGLATEAVYSATKGAVDSFTKAIAKELGHPYKIRCNTIQPGMIVTPLNNGFMTDEKRKIRIEQVHSIKRAGMPIDVAQQALYLASEASSFVTGAILECGGGW